MSFMTRVIAVQALLQKRLEALEAAPLDNEFRLSCVCAALAERDTQLSALVNAVESVSVETAGEPCETCSKSDDRTRSNLCAARVVGIECGFEFVLKQRFICPNCPSLGGHRPQGRCKICPDQD